MSIRKIARLDIKRPYLIKGYHMEGLKKLGAPETFAGEYSRNGIDEVFYVDHVASLYGMKPDLHLIHKVCGAIKVPLIVAGGIDSLECAHEVFTAGADVVAINTHAIHRPALIREISNEYGSQSTTVHIDAKLQKNGWWECYTHGGREHTGREVKDWMLEAISHGAGQIILSSVDKDGLMSGLDFELIEILHSSCSVPFVVSSGIGERKHLNALGNMAVDGIAVGAALHYKKINIIELSR